MRVEQIQEQRVDVGPPPAVDNAGCWLGRRVISIKTVVIGSTLLSCGVWGACEYSVSCSEEVSSVVMIIVGLAICFRFLCLCECDLVRYE